MNITEVVTNKEFLDKNIEIDDTINKMDVINSISLLSPRVLQICNAVLLERDGKYLALKLRPNYETRIWSEMFYVTNPRLLRAAHSGWRLDHDVEVALTASYLLIREENHTHG